MLTARFGVFLILIHGSMLAVRPARAENRDALREIVQEQCTLHWLQARDPAPCERLYLPDARNDGYAVLADRKGGAHFLLIPTKTIMGIESPDVLEPQAPNYFNAAWAARDRIAAVVGHDVKRGDIGLAVNPEHGRGQDQLHIHIECLGATVHEALRSSTGLLTDSWSPLDLPQGRYSALRVMGEDLEGINPFVLLANLMPDARREMGAYTLVVAGMQFKDGSGFVLLAGKSVPRGETLLDSTCVVSKRQQQ